MAKMQTVRDSVIGSALWAAAGDALGWITELGDHQTIEHRTGSSVVHDLTNWQRRIGGRFGPTVQLPAGTYSDDTQLRLAVSRAINGVGEFDVEAFAKVELPVWMSYSLGAGRGTTAAALNLCKGSVSWFSNFFSSNYANYFKAGGNGACMRIQPHVWKANPQKPKLFLAEVIRDAIVTHGHPKGFLGAAFHAYCLAHALEYGEIPSPADWQHAISEMSAIPDLVKVDDRLGLIWLPAWEQNYGSSLADAVGKEVIWATDIIKQIKLVMSSSEAYDKILQICGGRTPETMGAGLNTAIIASALAWLCASSSNEETLRIGANAIGSDTDTIITMTGAIIGAVRPEPMTWPLQDASYIEQEAVRMAKIRGGERTTFFKYPDLLTWSPPTSQIDAVGVFEGDTYLRGLGRGERTGEVWKTSDAEWQWIKLDFGQSVLAKSRAKARNLELEEISIGSASPELQNRNARRFLFSDDYNKSKNKQQKVAHDNARQLSLDAITDEVIKSNFSVEIIGKYLTELALRDRGIESAMAFTAIIAKALAARKRRS